MVHFWNNLHRVRKCTSGITFIVYAQCTSGITFIVYARCTSEITFIVYAWCTSGITFIVYSQSQDIGKSNNLKFWGSNKTKEPKEDSQNHLMSPEG